MLFQFLPAKSGSDAGERLAKLSRHYLRRPVVIGVWVISELTRRRPTPPEFPGGMHGFSRPLHFPMVEGMAIMPILIYALLPVRPAFSIKA
jgi:Mn2+/Fe2+ NRAMP family transporter